MKNLYFLLALLFLFTATGNAQTTREEVYATPEKSGGVYYAYPYQSIGTQTPAPKGYKPFYISHLGRHGSRYLISDDDYSRVIEAMEEANQANALTPLGKDVLSRLQQVWEEVEGHGGDLSPLGVREQRGIAERMYQNFPEVFTGSAPISARSTMVVRCVLSMDAFCERLKELNPALQTNRESSEKYVRYLNHHTREAIAFRSAKYTWREQYRKFEDSHVKPERLIASLFSDPAFVNRRINPKEFMMDMFYIANGMQNIETNLSFYDIFEKEELFDIYQCKNFKVYAEDSNCAWNGGIMMENAKPLVRNILESANEAIANGNNGATLRFAHDGNIVPLAMLMHLKDCYNSVSDPNEFYKAFSTFKVAPMAGNIQMIFFRKKGSDDILVKFLQNENETSIPVETDMFPYYNWKDVEAFYTKLLNTNFNID